MTIKILTVDDEPDVRRLIEIKLKKAGFEVITAADGEEGVKMLAQVGEGHPQVGKGALLGSFVPEHVSQNFARVGALVIGEINRQRFDLSSAELA